MRRALVTASERIRRRVALFDAERARQQQQQEDRCADSAIVVRLPRHRLELSGAAGHVSVLSLLRDANQVQLLRDALVARLDGARLHDLARPLAASCAVELLGFGDAEGRDVFWHSSAHVLGAALERIYGDRVLLCDGPAISRGGFFYEFHLDHGGGPRAMLTDDDLAVITRTAQAVAAERAPFERLEVSREFALHMFDDNRFKQHFIAKAPANAPVTLYRCHDFIDFCRGPHIPHTGLVRAFETLQASGAYWLGQQSNEQLQRVYGIAFPEASQLRAWKDEQERIKRSDHRVIGRQQRLFMMHELSPGSVFMLPHGTHICNRLIEFMRSLYHSRAYEEVITPQLYMKKLWETSGHWDNYREDMFLVQLGGHQHADEDGHGHVHGEGDEHGLMALKPMNCPGHCLVFAHEPRSYRDLPVRIADFSPLHRNEISGALSGLTRVRKFMQDDAHIFCRQDQVRDEVAGVLRMIADVYGVFGFAFDLALSTRPAKYLGELAVWERAEASLHEALVATGRPFSIAEGDGAFYGPKIDITVQDAVGRRHQTATVQLDFQLPERFELQYTDSDGAGKRPVIIHRAVLGSVERMMGILTEHYAGKWPFWLSPRHALVVPVHHSFAAYAQEVVDRVRAIGCSAELSRERLRRAVLDGATLGYNYVLVVGEQEAAASTVSVRPRGTKDSETVTLTDLLARFARDNELPLKRVHSG